ncbi:MAG: serine kinase [Phreatobacter sp.]|nr:serine kinase [Phreatobacter sp.]
MASIHASAVLVGPRAVLVRGPSGSGKSALVHALLDAAHSGLIPFARLVADDRVILSVHHGRLLARAPDSIAGLVERRGAGVVRLPHEAQAVVGWIVDLDAPDAARMPADQAARVVIEGVALPRIPVATGVPPLPLVLDAIGR